MGSRAEGSMMICKGKKRGGREALRDFSCIRKERVREGRISKKKKKKTVIRDETEKENENPGSKEVMVREREKRGGNMQRNSKIIFSYWTPFHSPHHKQGIVLFPFSTALEGFRETP